MPPTLTPQQVLASDMTALKHAAQTVFDRTHTASENDGHKDEDLRQAVSQMAAALTAISNAELCVREWVAS